MGGDGGKIVGFLKESYTLRGVASLCVNGMMCNGGVGLGSVAGFGSGWCLGIIGDVILGSVGTFGVGGTSSSGVLTGGVGNGNSGCKFIFNNVASFVIAL